VKPRRRLARKYLVLLVSLVSGALLASGALQIYVSYQENKAHLVALQREKAVTAAIQIEQYVREVERQIGWTTQLVLTSGSSSAAALEQRRFDFLRLLRQSPPVTEVAWVDGAGRERLRISRLAMDVVGSDINRSREPWFASVKAERVYFSPVYFRKDSEPYLSIAVPSGC
jgi:hypothetical protein